MGREDDWRRELEAFFEQVGADEEGRLGGDAMLSTGEEMPFVFTPVQVSPPSELELPGKPPYRRGVYETMYRGRLWTMRQYAGFGTAEETNQRFRYLLEQGQTGLSVAFDLPTQMGLDSDHPLARGEVGRVGVAIDSVEDMHELFDGIPLDRVSVSMTINATAPILLAMLQVVAEERGVRCEQLRGTTQNDILKEYVARGTYVYPPGPSLWLCAKLVQYCSERVPKWNPISISGYHMREAGADAVQEVAFTLASGLEYVRATTALGLDVDSFAPRLSFFFGCHNHFLEEVAKFRAARVLWAKLMSSRMGAKNPKSLALRFHTQTAGCTLTAAQPQNNVVRVALQALAAVLGGTQSLHTNSLDEALSLPTKESATLALRTQQIIAYESHVADFADPLGGSYVVEALTDRILSQAERLIDEVEGLGGMAKAVDEGFPQREIERSAYRYQQMVENGRIRVVGVNCFRAEEEDHSERITVDEELRRALTRAERRRVVELGRFKEGRDGAKVRAALAGVETQARDRGDVMGAIVDAVRSRCTVGEISEAMGRVFGRHRQSRLSFG